MPAVVKFAVLLSVAGGAGGTSLEPLKQCSFGMTPDLPYYWEPTCTLETPGCWADSANVECRFCGSAPYTGIPCPPEAVFNVTQVARPPSSPATPEAGADGEPATVESPKGFLAASSAAPAEAAAQVPEEVAALSEVTVSASSRECKFANPPRTPYYYEPQCVMGMVGCNADGKTVQCRFCGAGAYAKIKCRPADCIFPNEPRTPYYWDETCAMNVTGCNADGLHVNCRFCVQRPFSTVNCPASLRVEPGKCTFPGLAPTTPHMWDPSCEFGKLGCWADGLHAECRWCGEGAFKDVACRTAP